MQVNSLKDLEPLVQKEHLYYNWEFEDGSTLKQERLVCKYCLRLIVISEYRKASNGAYKHFLRNYDPNYKLHKGFPKTDFRIGLKYSDKRTDHRFWNLECPICLELLEVECREHTVLGRPKSNPYLKGKSKEPFHKVQFKFPNLAPCQSGFLDEDILVLKDIEGNLYHKLKDGRIYKVLG